MANKVRFLFNGVLDDSTVSASSEATGLPAINVRDKLIRKVYASTGKANEWVRMQASGGATGMDAVFIGNHNFTKDAVVLWQLNTTSDFSSGPAVNVTLGVATDTQGKVLPKITYYFNSATTFEFARLYVEDSGNASSTLQIGRILAGRYLEPNRNLRDGFRISTFDPTRQVATGGRQGYANIRKQYMELSYAVGQINEAEQDEFLGLFGQVGMHKPFLVSLDPVDRPHHNSAYVQITGDVSRQHHFLKDMSFNEVVFQEKN